MFLDQPGFGPLHGIFKKVAFAQATWKHRSHHIRYHVFNLLHLCLRWSSFRNSMGKTTADYICWSLLVPAALSMRKSTKRKTEPVWFAVLHEFFPLRGRGALYPSVLFLLMVTVTRSHG